MHFGLIQLMLNALYNIINISTWRAIINAGLLGVARRQRCCVQSASKWTSTHRFFVTRIVLKKIGLFINLSTSLDNSRPRKRTRGSNGQVHYVQETYRKKGLFPNTSSNPITFSLPFLKNSNNQSCRILSKPRVNKISRSWEKWRFWLGKP